MTAKPSSDCIISTHQKVVFAAMSKKSFFLREYIVKYILDKKCTPTCAFMMFSYFLLDTTDREGLINATNALILKSDELWVFGPISDGVACEINLANKLQIPIKYFDFSINGGISFKEVDFANVRFEDKKSKLKIISTSH